MRRLTLGELQADEIQTIVGGNKQSIWVLVVIDVWSRPWPATVVGKRTYRNTLDLFRNGQFASFYGGVATLDDGGTTSSSGQQPRRTPILNSFGPTVQTMSRPATRQVSD